MISFAVFHRSRTCRRFGSCLDQAVLRSVDSSVIENFFLRFYSSLHGMHIGFHYMNRLHQCFKLHRSGLPGTRWCSFYLAFPFQWRRLSANGKVENHSWYCASRWAWIPYCWCYLVLTFGSVSGWFVGLLNLLVLFLLLCHCCFSLMNACLVARRGCCNFELNHLCLCLKMLAGSWNNRQWLWFRCCLELLYFFLGKYQYSIWCRGRSYPP